MTTSIFFPDAHPESTSVDGWAARAAAIESWTAVRTGAGSTHQDLSTTARTELTSDGPTVGDWIALRRGIALFDTSSLPDADVILSATFGIVNTLIQDPFAGGDSLSLVESTPASNIDLANSDYGNVGTTKQAPDLVLAEMVGDGLTYNVFKLNATGLASIDAAGITKFGLAITADVDDNEHWEDSLSARATWRTAEETEPADLRPRLMVEHGTPSFQFPIIPASPAFVAQDNVVAV